MTDRIEGMPRVPEPDPCDHRAQSLPVVIRTVRGEWYTARWTVYVDQDDNGIPPCWELVGRDGLQLDREDVAAWFDPTGVAPPWSRPPWPSPTRACPTATATAPPATP